MSPLQIVENIVRSKLEGDGWAVYHSGFPDFLCVKNGLLKFVEVKRSVDAIRPHQKAVISALESCSVLVEVVYEDGGLVKLVMQTTIEIDDRTRDRLKAAKLGGETYADVINRLLDERGKTA
jgi:hypothetical protein